MACFIVPAAEAVITAIAAKAAGSKEKAQEIKASGADIGKKQEKMPFSAKLKWLRNLLTGGSVLLAFEHVWHGEVVPWFPFLTAAGDPADAAEMLHEMATVGVSMAVLVTLVWLAMVGVSALIEKRSENAQAEEYKA